MRYEEELDFEEPERKDFWTEHAQELQELEEQRSEICQIVEHRKRNFETNLIKEYGVEDGRK